MKNPIKMDDLGVPLFLETPICPKRLLKTLWWPRLAICQTTFFKDVRGKSQKTFESIAGINRDTQLQLLSCRDWTYQQMPETYVRLFQKTSPPNDDHLTNRKKVEGGLIPVVNGL